MALAMPTPTRSPRIRTASTPFGSPSCAAATAALPSANPRCARERAPSRRRRPAPRASRAAASAAASAARRRSRSAATIWWPELGGGAGRAAEDPAVEDDPAADAGADREHHEHLRRRRPGRPSASASAAQVASLSTKTGTPSRLPSTSRSGTPASGMFTLKRARPGREVDDARHRDPDRVRPRPARSIIARELVEERLGRRRVGRLDVRLGQLLALERRDGDLRPSDVDADDAAAHGSSMHDHVASRLDARGGSRTHTDAGLKTAASASWATRARAGS